MNSPRFKIRSRIMPHTGRRRWHLQMRRETTLGHTYSTLTARYTHAEAIEALDRLSR